MSNEVRIMARGWRDFMAKMAENQTKGYTIKLGTGRMVGALGLSCVMVEGDGKTVELEDTTERVHFGLFRRGVNNVLEDIAAKQEEGIYIVLGTRLSPHSVNTEFSKAKVAKVSPPKVTPKTSVKKPVKPKPKATKKS